MILDFMNKNNIFVDQSMIDVHKKIIRHTSSQIDKICIDLCLKLFLWADFRKGGNIISDYEIIIPSLSKEIRLRKIIVRDPETKKRIVLLTNNMKWSAGTVAGTDIKPQKKND
jgi:hypothetical protein